MESARLPLSTLLSKVLVAFTIESDNEFEHQVPHRTTVGGASALGDGPWLVSMGLWFNVLQYVGDDKLTVNQLHRLARTTKLNLRGMQRWGYIIIRPDPSDPRSHLVHATRRGLRAQAAWRTLLPIMETRWETRFGRETTNELRESLMSLVGNIDIPLPDYLPIVGYEMFSDILKPEDREPAKQDPDDKRSYFPALLAKVLLAFALAFERKSDISMPMGANVIRLLDGKGVRIRDLPRLSGVSKEAIQMATGFLERRGYAVIEPNPAAPRTKLIRLTPKGQSAKETFGQRLGHIEQRFEEKFGREAIAKLRALLEPLAGRPTAQQSPLFLGLKPYPENWRASVPIPETLPHYPMVLHRGGYPDGS